MGARKMRKHLEDALQIQCATWLRRQYPKLLWWHCPNGGGRSAREGARLKRMGVLAGVADFTIIHPGRSDTDNPLISFLELKIGKGTQSESQIEFQIAVERLGCSYKVCRSFEEFVKTVREWVK
jgi:hypothetical protein